MDENGKEFWCFLEVQHGKSHCDAMGCNQCQPCEKYQRGDFRAHHEVLACRERSQNSSGKDTGHG